MIKRKYKIINVENDRLMTIFQFVHRKSTYFSFPLFKALPKGYEVHRIHHNPIKDCFEFFIWHESFPEVPEGVEIPTFEKESEIVYNTVELKWPA